MQSQPVKTPPRSRKVQEQQAAAKTSVGSRAGLTGSYSSVPLTKPQSTESAPASQLNSNSGSLPKSQDSVSLSQKNVPTVSAPPLPSAASALSHAIEPSNLTKQSVLSSSQQNVSVLAQSQKKISAVSEPPLPSADTILEIRPDQPSAAECMIAQEKGHRIVVLKNIGRRMYLNQGKLVFLQRLLKKRIFLWRFITLVRVMVARVRHHKLMTAYLAEFKSERVATLMQSVVRSWLIRRRWRLVKVKALTESRKNSMPPAVVGSLSSVRANALAAADEADSERNFVTERETDTVTGKTRKVIKRGTLMKLIEKATQWDQEEFPNYTREFLYTFDAFVHGSDLLEIILARYDQLVKEPPKRAGIVKFIRQWLELTSFDWSQEEKLRNWIATASTQQPQVVILGQGSLQVLSTVLQHQKKAQSGPSVEHIWECTVVSKMPASLVPATVKSIPPLVEINPEEVARQLTLISEELFHNLRIREFINLAWTKPAKEIRSPSVLAIIHRFNATGAWVGTAILDCPTPEARAKMISFFVKKLVHLRNYDAAMAIMAGLRQNAVLRLKDSWAMVHNAKKLETLRLTIGIESNYKAYRATLKETPSSVPCIPFIAPFLADLTFIDENPSKVDGLTNFIKCRLVYNVLEGFLRFQTTRHNFEPIIWLQKVILTEKYHNEDELYELSLKREPRVANGEEVNELENSKKKIKHFVVRNINKFADT